MAIGVTYRPFTVAKILGIKHNTVARLLDQHYLPTTFDERGRCVTRNDLVKFMKEHGWWECTPAVSRYLLELEP